MSRELPGYDDWLTHNPDDDRCEHCGALPSSGWQPDECSGKCGKTWRDPDAEREAARDDPDPADDYADRAEWNARLDR